jgi:DNA-binding MarR family transcriptional regulator
MATRSARVTDETPATDTTEMAARLRLSATRLARQLRQQAGSGLTPTQLSALATISNRGPLTLGALADHERVAPPTITRVVGKLEDASLVTREVDAVDRRISRVATTSAGEALLAESRQRKNAWLAARLRQLDEHQQAQLHAALDVLDAITAGELP